MMTRDPADLWFSSTTPLGVAAEDAGAFGTVCGPLECQFLEIAGGTKKNITSTLISGYQ